MGKNKNGLKKYDNVGYFFVLPFVIVFCIFSVYPVLRTLYFSFTNAKIAGVGVTSWVWFDNYKRVFTDKFFLESALEHGKDLGCEYRITARTCIFTYHCI